ncbi:MAG TPA: hypothetical protein VGT00_05480 [Methylomirabilota bacterium]|jgi:hypothetical protein|nr:hypothetical protein [Methylomirabilota bacterium]
MRVFHTVREAKDFFISRIVEQANREHHPLSDLETRMLYFTETGPEASSGLMESAAEFEATHDDAKYEQMIAGLLNRAYRADLERARQGREDDPRLVYRQALDLLRTEDHYLTIMIEQGIGDKLSWGGWLRKFLGIT